MKRFINNITIKTLVVAIVALASSCTANFEDYNTPKDKPGIGSLPGPIANGLLLKDMQMQVLPAKKNQYQFIENLLGGSYAHYFASTQPSKWAGSYIYFNPPYVWANAPFDDTMTSIYGSWLNIKAQTKEEGISFAWAQIIRVAAMHRLTDIQGPIPYSLMGKGGGLVTPYDTQEDAYMAMFEDLDAAIKELVPYVAISPDDRTFKPYDLIYDGDMSKWIRLANSLKLRMAMRISFVNPTKAREYAEAALSHTYGVITSNDDNAAIDFSGTGDKNPLRWLVEDYQDVVAGADIVTYMNSYSDPRRAVYFNLPASGSEYAGLRLSAKSLLTWRNSYSLPKAKETDKLIWISASEVAFLKAEMALNGWNVGGATAKSLYEEAITLSFTQNGLTTDEAAGYYADATSVPTNHTDARGNSELHYTPSTPYSLTIAWKDSDDDEIKREKIITQKWIAIYPLGIEAWSEQRRTGYPRFYPTSNNGSQESGLTNRGPSRLPFALSEAENSPDNYAKAVQLLGGGDLFGTKLWWDVKTNKPAW